MVNGSSLPIVLSRLSLIFPSTCLNHSADKSINPQFASYITVLCSTFTKDAFWFQTSVIFSFYTHQPHECQVLQMSAMLYSKTFKVGYEFTCRTRHGFSCKNIHKNKGLYMVSCSGEGKGIVRCEKGALYLQVGLKFGKIAMC